MFAWINPLNQTMELDPCLSSISDRNLKGSSWRSWSWRQLVIKLRQIIKWPVKPKVGSCRFWCQWYDIIYISSNLLGYPVLLKDTAIQSCNKLAGAKGVGHPWATTGSMEGVAMEVLHGLKGTTTPVFVWWATSVYVWGFQGTGKRLDLLLYSFSLEYNHGWLKGTWRNASNRRR